MLKGRSTIDGRPGESLEPLDFDALKKKLQDEYGTICFLTLLLVIFQSQPDWRTRNSEQYFLLRFGVVIWNLPICIWGIISLRLSFPLVKVRRLILSFPERVKFQPKIPNFILWNAKIQILPIESTAKEVSFEWSHWGISFTDSKVDSITWSGRERVKWSSDPLEKASKSYSLIFNAFLREVNTLAPTGLLKL